MKNFFLQSSRCLKQTKMGAIHRRFGDKCPFETKIAVFQSTRVKDLEQEYSIFLQDIRQYFQRGSTYDLYNLTFIKQILSYSMKRYSLYQISSIVYFRKVRRYKKYATDTEYYFDVKQYMNDFYYQRSEEINDTLKDLCLVYDVAAEVIFESLGKEDKEIFLMLHDNKYFVELLPPQQLPYKEAQEKLTTAFNVMKDQEMLLEINDDERRGDDIWIIYTANLLKSYDRAFDATGLEEEDIREFSKLFGKLEYMESVENSMMEKVKAKYIPLAILEETTTN